MVDAQARAPGPRGRPVDFSRIRREWEQATEGAGWLERVPWLTFKQRRLDALLQNHDYVVDAQTLEITLYPRGSLQ